MSVDDVVLVVVFVDALPPWAASSWSSWSSSAAAGAPSTCWAWVIAACMAWMSVWNPARFPAFRAASALV